MNLHYPITQTSTTLIDQDELTWLYNVAMAHASDVVVVGFNEYAKHLINLTEGRVTAVLDPDPARQGLSFKGVRSLPLAAGPPASAVLMTEFEHLHGTQAELERLYPGRVHVPPRLHYQSPDFIDPRRQDPLYRAIYARKQEAPPTMMTPEKLYFLMELVRAALMMPGDIAEFGVYQGGSTWYIASLLRGLGEKRRLFMFDVFESHMMHPNATISNDEVARKMSHYPHVVMVEGLVGDPVGLSKLAGHTFCFVHYDLGWDGPAMNAIWDRLLPGGYLLLDNYGHLGAAPWLFDEFFEARGCRIIRFPWSEQGLVIKR